MKKIKVLAVAPQIKKPIKRKPKKKEVKQSRYITKDWKVKILDKQQELCVGKDCSKNHNGKQVKVTLRNAQFDHKKPISMGGEHTISNIQAFCANCHAEKTTSDRAKISKWKKKQVVPEKPKVKRAKKQKKWQTIKILKV